MRIIIILILVILLGSAAYTGYSVMTFEPEKPKPLVFKEPDPETLKQLGVYTDSQSAAVKLSPEEEARSKAAVDKISAALATYQSYELKATPRLASTLQLIDGAIGSGQLPAYFLNVTDALSPKRAFEMLKFDPTGALVIKEPQTSVSCSNDSTPTSVLIGDNGDNVLGCSSAQGQTDQIFLAGPGNDTISDTFGNRIVNAGSGDDTITLGPGRTILVLEEGWGHDRVTVDCRGASVAPSEIPAGFPVPWVYKFTNFILLSPRIPADAVKWDASNKVLTNTASGDTLTLNENCFNLVGSK